MASPRTTDRGGPGIAANMTRLALLQDGFDLADLYAVEGWHATGAVALDAELASVQPVATGVGDDPLGSPIQ
jgi:hypothetical protein